MQTMDLEQKKRSEPPTEMNKIKEWKNDNGSNEWIQKIHQTNICPFGQSEKDKWYKNENVGNIHIKPRKNWTEFQINLYFYLVRFLLWYWNSCGMRQFGISVFKHHQNHLTRPLQRKENHNWCDFHSNEREKNELEGKKMGENMWLCEIKTKIVVTYKSDLFDVFLLGCLFSTRIYHVIMSLEHLTGRPGTEQKCAYFIHNFCYNGDDHELMLNKINNLDFFYYKLILLRERGGVGK